MRIRYFMVAALLLLLSHTGLATKHTITNSGTTFSPSSLTISVGDTVVFTIAGSHNAVEVSQATWNANGNTPLSGGFSVAFGGGTVVFSAPGTEYFVCTPHASLGMKGVITVEQTSISTGSIASSSFCSGDAVTVPFTAMGTYTGGNVFTAQLSDAAGSFAAPVNIGTLSSMASGQISATIPANTTTGSGYRIMVVSSQPVVTGTNNGSDLSVAQVPAASITPAGPTTFCEGLSVQLNATTGPGLTYVWRRDGNAITGAITASYTALLSGLYTVEISSGTCTSTSNPRPVNVLPGDPTTLTWTAGVDADWSTVGNWDSQCAIPTNGDTVTIPASLQTPTGIPAVSLSRLVVNNANGLTLSNDLEITGTLVLTNGNVTLGSANLTIASTGMISGGGASSFIVTDGSGELRQADLGSGGRSGTVLFPVGSTGFSYTPVSLLNGGTMDEFRVIVRDDVLIDGSSGSPLSTNVVDKTWFISEASAGGSSADMVFQWNGTDELPAFTRSTCYISHHDGSMWVPTQSIGAATGSTTYQRSVAGVSAFSPFAIGDGASPLPVAYRTFTADVAGDAVILRWVTEGEVNNAGFDVERASRSAGPWNAIEFVPGSDNGAASAQYQVMDTPPESGEWFYRLRQIDLDGTAAYSPVLRTQISAPRRALAITSTYPNPISLASSREASLTFTAPNTGRSVVTMYNLLGRRVAVLFDGTVDAGSSTAIRFSISALPPGVYTYRLEHGGRAKHQRTIITR